MCLPDRGTVDRRRNGDNINAIDLALALRGAATAAARAARSKQMVE